MIELGVDLMEKTILVRYGEISLKGKNRAFFEQQLIKNIKSAIRELGPYQLEQTYGRIFIHIESGNINAVLSRLKLIPGIVSISPVVVAPLDYSELEKAALKIMQQAVVSYPASFKVESKRANKKFPLKSPEISREIGGYLLNNFNNGEQNRLTVDLHRPDYTLYLEIRAKQSYLYTNIIAGPGGLPVGSSGRGLLLLSGGIDSPVAGWLGMKRGMQFDAIYFHSPPYTSDRAKEKVIELAHILSRYNGKINLFVNYFTEIQQAIRKNCPPPYYITIMRRMMLRIATTIARNNQHLALLTGESIGQVASQTLESINVINQVTNLAILRPLITMDKTEIVSLAREIGTYDTSILPYADCCTIFVPENPVIRPGLAQTLQAEKDLPVEELSTKSIEKTELLSIVEN